MAAPAWLLRRMAFLKHNAAAVVGYRQGWGASIRPLTTADLVSVIARLLRSNRGKQSAHPQTKLDYQMDLSRRTSSPPTALSQSTP